MLVVITGVPGIGKSTTVKTAFKKMEDEAEKYEVVNYGDVMYETAKEGGLVEHRDEIRKLSTEKQHQLQEDAAKVIHEKAKQENIILDTHATIKTPAGYIPGMPEWVLKQLKPDCIVVIEKNEGQLEDAAETLIEVLDSCS